MKTFICTLYVLLAYAALSFAQTSTPTCGNTTVTAGPVTAGMCLAVSFTDVPLADAPNWSVSFKVDGSTVATFNGGSCVASTVAGETAVCKYAITQTQADAINKPGLRSLAASVFQAGVPDSGASVPFQLPFPARPPKVQLTK